tara:strand:+ start:1269 stop:1757 length:489 start_codon:yes stop_codon:yes gene_type:complete
MAKSEPSKFIVSGTNLNHLGKDALIVFALRHFGLNFSSHTKRNGIVKAIVRASDARAKAVAEMRETPINGHEILAEGPSLIPGTEPLERQFQDIMMGMANHCDAALNPGQEGPARKVGFVLLVFPFGQEDGKVNYLTNGADRAEIIRLMQAQVDGFKDGSDA